MLLRAHVLVCVTHFGKGREVGGEKIGVEEEEDEGVAEEGKEEEKEFVVRGG